MPPASLETVGEDATTASSRGIAYNGSERWCETQGNTPDSAA